MTAAAKALLDSSDALSEAEWYEVVVALLRRTTGAATAELPDETLVTAAEELFRELDAREAADVRS